jgi:hypothetical protein
MQRVKFVVSHFFKKNHLKKNATGQLPSLKEMFINGFKPEAKDEEEVKKVLDKSDSTVDDLNRIKLFQARIKRTKDANANLTAAKYLVLASRCDALTEVTETSLLLVVSFLFFFSSSL